MKWIKWRFLANDCHQNWPNRERNLSRLVPLASPPKRHQAHSLEGITHYKPHIPHSWRSSSFPDLLILSGAPVIRKKKKKSLILFKSFAVSAVSFLRGNPRSPQVRSKFVYHMVLGTWSECNVISGCFCPLQIAFPILEQFLWTFQLPLKLKKNPSLDLLVRMWYACDAISINSLIFFPKWLAAGCQPKLPGVLWHSASLGTSPQLQKLQWFPG